MGYRPLDITLISATDLKYVNRFTRMKVYAIAYLSSDLQSKQMTHDDKHGAENPTWNFPMKFKVPDQSNGPPVDLHIQLLSDRIGGDTVIGEVRIPIEDLLNTAGPSSGDGPSSAAQFVSYRVIKPSGKPKGVLNISFKFGEVVSAPTSAAAAATTPVAVGAAASGSSGNPPPPYSYGYQRPPQPQPSTLDNVLRVIVAAGSADDLYRFGQMTLDSNDAYVAGNDAGFD